MESSGVLPKISVLFSGSCDNDTFDTIIVYSLELLGNINGGSVIGWDIVSVVRPVSKTFNLFFFIYSCGCISNVIITRIVAIFGNNNNIATAATAYAIKFLLRRYSHAKVISEDRWLVVCTLFDILLKTVI